MTEYYKSPDESIAMRNHHYQLQWRDVSSLKVVTLNYMNDVSIRSSGYHYDMNTYCARKYIDRMWIEIQLTDDEWFDIILPKINEILKEYNL